MQYAVYNVVTLDSTYMFVYMISRLERYHLGVNLETLR